MDDSSPVDGRTGALPIASGKSPNVAVEVVGRDDELARIRDVVAEARDGRCAALVLEGEPGIGKTTLLESARSLASGFTCLSAHGVESESVLAHSGLLELLNPVKDLLDEVPDAQADALRAALAWAVAEAPADRFLVAAATLSLLAAAAARRPVLVLVDDLHWLDRESAAAILFAARRLGPDSIAFVFSARSGSVPADLVQGLPVVSVAGVSVAAAFRLVPTGTAEAVVDQLTTGTLGNPLALLEVSHRLTPAQRVGAAPLPDPLPVGNRLQTVYETLLSGLSADAWQAVLLLAVDRSGSTAVVGSALADGGVDLGATTDEGIQRGILVVDEYGIRFRHPLLRAAVLRMATPAQQRTAHRRLAAALPADSPARIWHLADAGVGADDHLAEELVQVASTDRVRLGFAAASAALERAALLTKDPELAARRLADAAEDAFVAGDVARTRTLADRVVRNSVSAVARGQVLFTLGMLEQYAGSVPRSVDHLAAASELLGGVQLVRALAELAMARFRLNHFAGIVECAERIDAVADLSDPEQRLLSDFTAGMALTLQGDMDAGRTKLTGVKTLALSEELRHDPRALLLLAVSAGFAGEIGAAITAGAPRLDDVRRRGAVGVLVPNLALLAAGRAWLGDHAGAFADAGEAAELAEQLGYAADASVAVEMLAWQSAARGLHDDARRALALARALTDKAGTTSVAAHQALTAAFCALCRGELTQVVDLLEVRLAVDGGVGAMGEPLGVAPLLVEAYVGLGRTEDAITLTSRFAEVTPPAAMPITRALVGRCQGMTAVRSTRAHDAFENTLSTHAGAEDTFEAARTRLLYGARLRREGQRVASRKQLRRAYDEFTTMDLTHWARQAADELAATGASVRRPGPGTHEPLTSQETRVALLVAEGLSNREVAAALFLSPKTIERHLGNVFRKRGFKSRTELARAFARHLDAGSSTARPVR